MLLNKKGICYAAVALFVAVSAFAGPKWTTAQTEDITQKKDFAKIFTAYECSTDKKDVDVNPLIEAFFTANREATIAEIKKAALPGTSYNEIMKYGAMRAAEYLKAAEALSELEAYLLAEKLWYPRSACASAIDTIDDPSSKDTVIAALEKEHDASVMTNLAGYLERHPVAGSKPLLEAKLEECKKLQKKDVSAVLTKMRLDRALTALKKIEP